MKTDPRVAAYIAKAKPFAQPILEESRKRIQKACPEVEETIKWNVPFFLIDGKIVASMAGFKQHVKVGVWVDMKPVFVDVSAVDELPAAKDFIAQVQAAAKQVDGGAKAPAKKAPAKKVPTKKAPAKKAPAKKASAKKAPAKKK